MIYLKVFTDFAPSLELLGDVEAGRLFKAMLKYAESGEDTELRGNEKFLWMVAKANIDRERTFCEKQKHNGKLGGRPSKKPKKTQRNPEKPNESQKSQQDQEQEQEQEQDQEQEQEKRQEQDQEQEKRSWGAAAAAVSNPAVAKVCKAWDKASGRCVTMAQQEELLALLDEYGEERLLYAIRQGVDNNAVKLAYIRAVLEGRGKKTGISVFEQQKESEIDAWVKAYDREHARGEADNEHERT